VTGQVRTDATYFHGQNISGTTVPVLVEAVLF
jgi:hypothetical protein